MNHLRLLTHIMTGRFRASGRLIGNWPAYSRPVSDESPKVLGIFVAQNVTIAVGGEHAKIGRAGRIPAVLDRGDLEGMVT
jgi:hypothetical protein